MKLSALILLSLISLNIQAQLKEYRELIIIPGKEEALVENQLALFTSDSSGMKERDIKVTVCRERACLVSRDIEAELSAFQVVLVGKDGGVKKKWKVPVKPRELFSVIDSMPMRQSEMRSKQ